MRSFAMLIFSALVSTTAIGQVYKCKDASGRVTYSNMGCQTSHSGQAIMRERTFQEKMREREDAYDAEMLKQERRRIKAEQQAIENAEFAQEHAQQAAAASAGSSYSQRLQQRNAAVSSNLGRPKTRAERGLPPLQTANPNSNPTPSTMTNCAGGFCHDNQGGVYHQHGNGTTMTGPSGSTCVRTGSMVQC